MSRPFRSRRDVAVVKHAVLILFAVLILLPFLWALITSLKPDKEILAYPPTFYPTHATADNYIRVMVNDGFLANVLNSVVVTTFSVILTLIASMFAGYAVARYPFPGKEPLMFLLLAGMAIGSFTNVIPLYFMAIKLGMFDTYYILILAYAAFNVPLVTWLMQSYFRNVPPAIEESAKIDGCNVWVAFWRVVIPNMKPAIVAGAVIAIAGAWNEFIFALTLTRSASMRTISVALNFFLTDYGVQWGQLTAASVIATVPILIVFLWLQRYFLQGLTSGTLGGT